MGTNILIMHKSKKNWNAFGTMKNLLLNISIEKKLYLTHLIFVTTTSRIHLENNFTVSNDILNSLTELAQENNVETIYAHISSLSGKEIHMKPIGFQCPLYTLSIDQKDKYPLQIGTDQEKWYPIEIIIENYNQFIDKYENEDMYQNEDESLKYNYEIRKKVNLSMFEVFVNMSKTDDDLIFVPSDANTVFYTSEDMLKMANLPYNEDWMFSKKRSLSL